MQNQYSNIPALLRERPNWVAWGVRNAPPKAPFNPSSLLSARPQPAKAGIKETWGSYQTAAECVRRGLAWGIGYEFDGIDIYGIDLDHVIDEAGMLSPQALEIVELLASYTEISPSGTGLHVFVFAPDADITRHRKKEGVVEIYSEGRYFTVTGHVYGGARSIETRTAELQIVHDRFLLPDAAQKKADSSPPVTDAEQEHFLKIGLIHDRVFRGLWSGERRHGNESADDQALMNKLAYWCNANPDAMTRAFLSSPYYHQKDEAHVKKCQRPDYLPNTANKACATVYSTAKADNECWQQNRNRERSHVR